MESQLSGWEAETVALEERVRDAQAELSEASRRHLEALNDRNAAARARLEQLKAASAGAWEDVRVGLEEAWDELREALQEARSHFDQEEPV